MAIMIPQIKTPPTGSEQVIFSAAMKKYGIRKDELAQIHINKISVDARKRDNILFVSSLTAVMNTRAAEERLIRKGCIYVDDTPYTPPTKRISYPERIAVAGFGPAGMFAALLLSRLGYRPLVLERGAAIDRRAEAVEEYKQGGTLDPNTNVQFGEGGAGTFSDGKLMTRIKDRRCGFVLKTFAEHGAPAEIIYKAKPHIGTDKLREVVKSIREEIIRNGGEVRFLSCVTDISVKDGALKSVTVNGTEEIPVSACIMCIGHSARDTFEMLRSKGVDLAPKPFAVGMRIEHKQAAVDESLYGVHAGEPLLPVGEYNLKTNINGRGVYTFCMCPGGTVVASQNEQGSIVTNGCSEYARNGDNANSAVVVSVSPKDFGNDVFDGVRFCEDIERGAFKAGNGLAPASTVGAFMDHRAGLTGATVVPTYLPGVAEARFDDFMPELLTDPIRCALTDFSRKMHCFGDMGAVLTAPETRTSSPVQILRNTNMNSVTVKGLYPCGEGAGYAGGITSAAVDGLKAAESVITGGIEVT